MHPLFLDESGTPDDGESSRWFRGPEPVFARHLSSGEVKGVGIESFPDSERPKRSRSFEPIDEL